MPHPTVTAHFYVQLEPEWGFGTDANGNKPVYGAKVARITQNRPGKPKGGTVMVKLAINIPKAAFLPLQPEAVIVIPADMIEVNNIRVEATPPQED